MPNLISKPTRVSATGNLPKIIDEVVGRVNTGESRVSIAHMKSPAGWAEPGQRPKFDEYTYILHGELFVEYEGGSLILGKGQALLSKAGEWIRYSSPHSGGAEYIAVCLPAFGPDIVNRDS